MAGYPLWLIYKWALFRMESVDVMLFDYCVVTGIVSAVFSGLFLGAEYSDGAIRNKLIIGHSRSAIYCSNLLTNIAAALLQCVVYLTVTLGLGIPLLGLPTSEPGRLLLLFAGTLGTVIAFCAVFTAIGMLCSQKAVAAVICIAGSFALFGMMSSVDSYLNIPKYSTHIDVQTDTPTCSISSTSAVTSAARDGRFLSSWMMLCPPVRPFSICATGSGMLTLSPYEVYLPSNWRNICSISGSRLTHYRFSRIHLP